MTVLEAVIRSRELLDPLTPLKRDCGRLCAAACCQPDEDGQGGMLLFPGEAQLYSGSAYALSVDHAVLPGMQLLTCSGTCKRSDRPLSCRMFPLTPIIEMRDGHDVLRVLIDPRAFSVCPLCESGIRSMDPAFVSAVRECAKLLCRHEEHRAYFRALGAYFARLRNWQEVLL